MNELFKTYAYIFLALRVLVDLVLGGIASYQYGTYAHVIALMTGCSVFYLFLYFGISNEEFRGRYGRRVCLNREPFAYWSVVTFLVFFHLIITALFVNLIRW